MAVLALVLIVAWLALVGGLRGYLQARRTGEVGVSFRDRRGSPQWWSRLISSVGFTSLLAAPLAELAGLRPVSVLDHAALRLAGVALVAMGLSTTIVAQAAMGASWRGDVNPEVRTELVTTGPFRWVRNPIFTATATTAIGFALMVPNLLAVLMLIAFLATSQIQVRLVEEPHLESIHGHRYRRYAERTGRFLPGSAESGPCCPPMATRRRPEDAIALIESLVALGP